MPFVVMLLTEPSNFQRLIVIVVMSLHAITSILEPVLSTALFAGLRDQ